MDARESTNSNGQSEGSMIFHSSILDAYRVAKEIAGENGRVAMMPEVIGAKNSADENSPVWSRYLITTSGEFSGESRTNIPIVVIAHGIDRILDNEEIMNRSTADLRNNAKIQLTADEFHELENGKYGEVTVLERKRINGLRRYASSVLTLNQALHDPLLRARLGQDYADVFLRRHAEITRRESENDAIIVNDHDYYLPQGATEYSGGLIHISQLTKFMRGGDKPDSISSIVDVADLSSAGRFVAVRGGGKLNRVDDKLSQIVDDVATNWMKLSVPNSEEIGVPAPYELRRGGSDFFVAYRNNGDVMGRGFKFHVNQAKKIEGSEFFTTEILGYHGFFKYEHSGVEAITPRGANAYLMGEPEIICGAKGNPIRHTAPIDFYYVEVDTSRRILKPKEIMNDIGLVRTIISG